MVLGHHRWILCAGTSEIAHHQLTDFLNNCVICVNCDMMKYVANELFEC